MGLSSAVETRTVNSFVVVWVEAGAALMMKDVPVPTQTAKNVLKKLMRRSCASTPWPAITMVQAAAASHSLTRQNVHVRIVN